MCDKVVRDKDVCERMCVTKLCVTKSARARKEKEEEEEQEKEADGITRTPHKVLGKKLKKFRPVLRLGHHGQSLH